jgi:uncharacterized membrane protein YkoI
MKKRIIIFGLIAVLIVSTSIMAFAGTINKTAKGEKEDDLTNVVVTVTEEDAVQTALNSVQNGSLVKVELEDENGIIVYGVEVNDGNQLHDIKVDANTGVILKDDIGSDADENEKEEAESDENDDAIINANVKVSQEEAVQFATQSVDAAAKFVKVELEDENGVIVYGVEFTLNGKDLDVKVDANTGTILATDQDDDQEDQDDEQDNEQDNDQDDDQVEHENDNEDEEGHED